MAGGSSYSVGSDGRGCLSIATSGGPTAKFRFALGGIGGGVASKGSIIESDDTTGSGSRASGIIRLQDTTSFALNQMRPNYAIGVDGWDTGFGFPGHFALAASFSVSNGGIANARSDVNDVTTIYVDWNSGSGIIGQISTSTGRAIGEFSAPTVKGFVIYMVSVDEFFIISPTLPPNGPLFSGRGMSTDSSFSVASVSGNYIFHDTVAGSDVINGSITGNAGLGYITFTNGTLSSELYGFNSNGNLETFGYGPSYTVDPTSGRLSLGQFTDDAVYLTAPTDGISGFYINFNTSGGSGFLEAQPSTNYSNASLAGNYFIGQDEPNQPEFQNLTGTSTLFSTGSATGPSDQSGPNGLQLNQPFSIILTINPGGTGSAGANTFAVANGAKVLILRQLGGGSQVIVLEPR